MDHKDYMSKEKTLVKKQIVWEFLDNQPTWKDLKNIEFQDDDTISVGYEDYAEDGSGDCWYISVERWIEETDEEFKRRLEDLENDKKRAKKMRYESYLRLKAEFESPNE